MPCRLSLACLLVLAACGGRAPDLMNFAASRTGPDEFAIVPHKPLEMPADMASLPPPRAAPNRADVSPRADAVAALGGRPETAEGQVPAADGALLAHAGRFGRDPAIRQTLAEEDLAFRRRNDGLFLERAFNVNLYFDAYSRQSLDQHAELQRLRRAGVDVPAAPPPPVPAE